VAGKTTLSEKSVLKVIKLFLAVLGSGLLVYASISYAWSIIQGKSKPHRISWGGWVLAGILGLWVSYDGGAKTGLLVTAVDVLIVLAIFLLSLWPGYGKPGGRKSDYIAGFIAAAALVLWAAVHFSPNIAAVIAITADAVFVWFTLRESWKQPETEAFLPWFLAAIGITLGFLTLGNYNFSAAAFPGYLVIVYYSIVGVLAYRKPDVLMNLRSFRFK
jgi:hypothetical protein